MYNCGRYAMLEIRQGSPGCFYSLQPQSCFIVLQTLEVLNDRFAILPAGLFYVHNKGDVVFFNICQEIEDLSGGKI